MHSLRFLCEVLPVGSVIIHQPEIHRADDGALEVLLGGGRPLCEPKSQQKAGGDALETTLGGGRPLCEIWVKFLLVTRGKKHNFA